MFIVSDAWRQTYPGAAVGVLALGNTANPERHPALEASKADLEARLRARYAGFDRAALKALPQIAAYTAYYKRFKKTYHLLLQLESVVFENKPIPRVAALVEAMFMAELDDLLLTAGHDLALVEQPLQLDVATGSERFVNIAGQGAVLASLLVSALGLFAIGAGITLLTGRSVWFSGLRQVVLGLLAAAITYGVGHLFGVALS
mgnify:CR=1 FL=1